MDSNIELISYAKLAEHSKARIDLPIRKYVLIANFLRRPKEEELEQLWFDTCLSKLDEEDNISEEDLHTSTTSAPPPPPPPPTTTTTSVRLHAYYNFDQKNGLLVYTNF